MQSFTDSFFDVQSNTSMIQVPERPKRQFLPEAFEVSSWEVIEPFFQELLTRPLASTDDLRGWFRDRSELESIVAEDFAWRYIRMTCFTDDEGYAGKYEDFVRNIQPRIAPYSDKLNRKAAESQYLKTLEKEPGYDLMIRNMRTAIEIFRDKNVPLFTQISTEQQKYSQVCGAMTIEVEGQEMTLPQASVLLMSTDREKREMVYRKVIERRLCDREELDALFTRLVALRHRVSTNAGFENFRDYMFKALDRFDYTPADCFAFHSAIEAEMIPLLNEMAAQRRKDLGVERLRPWDKAVDPRGRPALKPFDTGDELTDKAIEVFHRLDPWLGTCLSIMRKMGHLDLASRKAKAPGGYNYPLPEIGVPFIFMNATSTLRDMVTLMHEGGHAVHNFLTRDLELNDFKSMPSEVAELASMSMELITMDHWNVFFSDEDELKRAKREHLEDIVETLPWVATIDSFQHWLYEHPQHLPADRVDAWKKTWERFSDTITDWSGLDKARDFFWQKQLHLYEVPFYYIEYGMAQLGAIAIWRNFRQDPKKGLEGYMNALRLGATQSIPEVYKAAGIRFDFSTAYIRELVGFLRSEMERS